MLLHTRKHKIPFEIDEQDYETVNKHTWCICHYGYPVTFIGDNIEKVYHLILGKAPEGLEWDHIDRNKLNNKRSNLRLVTRTINSRNKNPQKNNTSGVSGVSWRKSLGKWRVRIKLDGKEICVGHFKQKQDAIVARKKAEKIYWETNDT